MSHLEDTFALAWQAWGDGTRLVAELRFAPPRRWRFDFADPVTRTAIEIEGGVWARGRHNRAAGFLADAEKYGTAARLGWQVLRIPGPALDDPAAVVGLVRRVLQRRRRERWPGLRTQLQAAHVRALAQACRKRAAVTLPTRARVQRREAA